MSRAQNRHDTAKWKKKRKDHDGAKCKVAMCPICSPHKRVGGNHSSRVKKKYHPVKDEEN